MTMNSAAHPFAAFLDHGQRPDDQRRDGDVELLFEAGSVKVVERQPQHQARQHHGHQASCRTVQ